MGNPFFDPVGECGNWTWPTEISEDQYQLMLSVVDAAINFVNNEPPSGRKQSGHRQGLYNAVARYKRNGGDWKSEAEDTTALEDELEIANVALNGCRRKNSSLLIALTGIRIYADNMVVHGVAIHEATSIANTARRALNV